MTAWRAFALAMGLFGSFVTNARAQTVLGAGSDPVPLWRVIVATSICIGLALVAGLVLLAFRGRLLVQGGRTIAPPRWFSWSRRAPRRLEVLDVTNATPALSFCVLAHDGEEYLIAATPQSVLLLDRRPRLGDAGASTGHAP